MTKKKKKRRLRFRIHLPQLQNKSTKDNGNTSSQPVRRKKKVKRHLRKELVYVMAAVVALILVITIPRYRTNKALRDLGYDNATIKNIRAQKLTDTLLDNQYYSAYLAQSINDGTLNLDYLPYYTSVSTDRGLSNVDFLLIGRLLDKGYEQDQIQNLLSSLHYWEITPLLVFDYQPIEQNYIDDCLAHEDVNSQSHFELSNSYYTPYEDPIPVRVTDATMLVNKTYYLSDTYTPDPLVDLSTWYAATGRQLQQEAADALASLCDAGRAVGVTFYAASAYRDYQSQSTIYNSYISSMGQEAADAASARPGYSEHQTGLAVDLAASNEDDHAEFKDTNAFIWVSSNCYTYGWILRFPEGKETITGYEYEPWHYRYLGVDLATKVAASGMTYDEYWCLYLKPWDNEANKPSDAILNALDSSSSSSSAEASADASAAASTAAAQ